MGTRSGDLDPAIVSFLCEELDKSASEVVLGYLNKDSGVLGLSGGYPMIFAILRRLQKKAINWPDSRSMFSPTGL